MRISDPHANAGSDAEQEAVTRAIAKLETAVQAVSLFLKVIRASTAMVGLIIASACSTVPAGVKQETPVPVPMPTVVTGSSPRWLMYQGGSDHNAVLPAVRINASWVVQFKEKINAGLAFDGRALYTDSFDHNVYALDPRSGRLLWKTATDNVVMSTPVVKDGVVIVGTGKDGWLNPNALDDRVQIWGHPQGDNIYALSASTGRVIWGYHTVGDDMASAAIDRDTVVFANGDLHAYGLDLKNGKVRWRIPILGVASMDSITIDAGVAFISSCRVAPHRCETAAVEVNTGNVKWTSPIGSADASPAVASSVVVTNMLDLDDTGKYAQGGRSTIAGLEERTGRTIWTWSSAPGPCTFVGSGEHEIAPLIDHSLAIDSVGCGSEVVALDVRSGHEKWKVHAYAHVKMSPIARNGHVYFGDTNGVFYDVNEKTGGINRLISFDQLFTTAPFIILGNTLFAVCGSEIYAAPIDHSFTPLSIPVHDIWNDDPIVNQAA